MNNLGQLIKLQDYISRYEIDIYRYPGQFIRLKTQQWSKVKRAWEDGTLASMSASELPRQEEVSSTQQSLLSTFNPLQYLIKSQKANSTGISQFNRENNRDSDESDFQLDIEDTPKTIDELKQEFLDSIFSFQLKWASSTIRDRSFVDSEYRNDDDLKYFLQRFPDNYLLLYKPIFLLKKAPIEVDIILLGPTNAWCIRFLDGQENGVFIGSKERFWIERNQNLETRVLSPLIGLNRTEKIVRQIFESHQITMPIKKVVLSRTSYIDYPYSPHDIMLVEKRNYQEWFNQMRQMSSPLKHMQLKAAQALFLYCQTSFVKRHEWE